jgi:hypothetical protein
MRRRDLITLLPFAAGFPPSDAFASKANNAPFAGVAAGEVNVKRDFGAKGDGVTDDWQAIESAGLFLEARGGGRMYFPAGRYRLPTFGKNITVRNYVEYCGDSASSVILGSNAAFVSPNGAIFGRNSYGKYTYYQAHDISAGAQSITMTTAADADNFKIGDIVIARSISATISQGDILPYFVEMNRVASVSGGVIKLEDPVDDGWNGVVVAKVTSDVSQGYSIHDLRIECEEGFPFFIQASYKSMIRNCWTRGFSVLCVNGFTRSVAHDIIATVLWSPNRMESLFEIETGSVRASVHDVEVQLIGAFSLGRQYPLFYCQEFSRRTSIRNVRVAGGGIALGNIITAFAGGHALENIHVVAQAVDKVLDYSCGDPGVFGHQNLPMAIKGITIDTLERINGFNHGFILYNNYPRGRVENVTVQDCVINGMADQGEHNLIWFFRGEPRNILFENVRGAADVRMSVQDGEAPSSFLNIQIRNCEYRRIASQITFEQATFVNCRRKNSLLPRTKRSPSGEPWTITAAKATMMAIVVPANATVCRGDYIELQFFGWFADPYGAHLAIKAFGATVMTINLIPSTFQALRINIRLYFAGNSFTAPDKYLVTGAVSINDTIVPGSARSLDSFVGSVPNLVELQAWSDRSDAKSSEFFVEVAAMTYVCAEG